MAAFIAKQMVGDKLGAVKGGLGGVLGDKSEEESLNSDGAVGGGEGEENGGEKKELTEEGEDPEVAEARREAEERRKEKHRKMEEEREDIRQGIRDKYGLKKKVKEVEPDPAADPGMEGRLGRKRKTPAELAAEANAEEEEEENSFMPANLDEFKSKLGEVPGKIAEVGEKCVVQ